MSVSTVDNSSTFFLASTQQKHSFRFLQDSLLVRCIHTTIKQRRREPLMIPHCFLLCLLSDFSSYLSYVVPAVSHILNEEVLPSSSLQSFPKYFPSSTGFTVRRRRGKEGALYCRCSPVPPPDLSVVFLEVWTQTKVASSIRGMIRQSLAWRDTYFKITKMLPAGSHIFRKVKQRCCQQSSEESEQAQSW